MTSEGILLLVPHVKLKKNEGELYMMTERLGWMVGNKGSFTVSHKYADIKTQKISPEGKPKIQLQVCLHDGSATTFQFVNPGGQADQLADREKVKELLQQMLPKFKRVVNKDLEEKQRLLSQNPSLMQLYMELVRTDIITPEEFWAEYAAPYLKQQSEAQSIAQQDTGISPSFLADIKPQTDGSNGSVRYVLTSETMASIFRTYPSVKQKHLKCVPHKMTEEEFWKKFFSSHYLHRDKNILDAKDLFTDCGKKDEEVLKQDLATPAKDPLLDLTNLNDVVQEEQVPQLSGPKASSIIHQNLIKRFNQHSILLMKASEKPVEVPLTQEAQAQPAEPLPAHKRARLEEAISYDDLEPEKAPPADPLNLSRIERYMSGPPTTVGQESNGNDTSEMQSLLDSSAYVNLIKRWEAGGDREYNLADTLPSATAIEVLKQLSVGGSLMRRAQPHAAIHLSPELQKELRQLYASLSEIIRHFWAVFPPTPQLAEKMSKVVTSLQRFNQLKLMPFEQKVIQMTTPRDTETILRPLKTQIQAALDKYSQTSVRRPMPKASVPM